MTGDTQEPPAAAAPAENGSTAIERLAVTTGRKIPATTASTLIRKAEEAKKDAEDLARLATLARAKEIKKMVEEGALPSISLLPLPEDSNVIAKIPTFFSRTPFFKPTRDRGKYDTTWENGEYVENPWYTVRRYGPGLNTYDEGTLMGIQRTTWRKQQKGPRLAHRLDVVSSASDLDKLDRERLNSLLENVTTVVGYASYYDICRSIDRGTGGRELANTRDSVKRLAKQVFEIFDRDSDKFTVAHILYLVGDECSRGHIGEEAGINVMFPPGMVEMMKTYTQIDLRIWRDLNDTGKSVYKFVNSHDWSNREKYDIYIDKLKGYVGFHGTIHEFRRALKLMNERLVDCTWATFATVESTGRKNAPKLVIVRK
ncbi:MAG: hypothetical protein ACYC9J_07010 [Sulfuricaulis sp.]